MEKSIIAEGKTTNEAIENGLSKLKVSRNMVDIKVLENEEKRRFEGRCESQHFTRRRPLRVDG